MIILNGATASIGSRGALGEAVAIAAAVFYAAYLLLLGRVRRRFSASSVMLWRTTAAALCSAPLLMAEPSAIPHTNTGWATLAALGLVSHAGGQGLIAYALGWLPITASSVTLLIQPVVSAILAWGLLGESLTAVQCIGGAIVLTGVLLVRSRA